MTRPFLHESRTKRGREFFKILISVFMYRSYFRHIRLQRVCWQRARLTPVCSPQGWQTCQRSGYKQTHSWLFLVFSSNGRGWWGGVRWAEYMKLWDSHTAVTWQSHDGHMMVTCGHMTYLWDVGLHGCVQISRSQICALKHQVLCKCSGKHTFWCAGVLLLHTYPLYWQTPWCGHLGWQKGCPRTKWRWPSTSSWQGNMQLLLQYLKCVVHT